MVGGAGFVVTGVTGVARTLCAAGVTVVGVAVVVVFVLPGTVCGGRVPIGGTVGTTAAAGAVALVGGTLEVTALPRAELGRARAVTVAAAAVAAAGGGTTAAGAAGTFPTRVPGGASCRGAGFFFAPFVAGTSISTSSLGIRDTLVRNSFSNACAITTTSSPGLLYT